MFEFFRNQRGIVTVFVTLILIPAMLITGTAVDVTRIYAGRSVVEDANLLALNAVLTQYDALLQDVYGLYAVMEDEPELGSLISEYIEVAILGESHITTGLGTLQLFYADDDPTSSISAVANQNLSNADVLQRQIEEYVKYQAPAIMLDEIFGILESFEKVAIDAEVIEQQMDIEEGLEDLFDYYIDIYDSIIEIEKFYSDNNTHINTINVKLSTAMEYLKVMNNMRDEYEYYVDLQQEFDDMLITEIMVLDEDTLKIYLENQIYYNECIDKFNQYRKNVISTLKGGSISTTYEKSSYELEYNDDGSISSVNTTDGEFKSYSTITGVEGLLADYNGTLVEYTEKITTLIENCQEAENQKTELKAKVNELEATLEEGECSEGLSNGLTEEVDGNSSILETYKTLLVYDTIELATPYSEDYTAMIEFLTQKIDDDMIKFGTSDCNITFKDISASDMMTDDAFNEIDFEDSSGNDLLDNLVDLQISDYYFNYIIIDGIINGVSTMYIQNFKDYNDEEEYEKFYDVIEEISSNNTKNSKSQKESVTEKLNSSSDSMQEKLKEMLNFEYGGADYYRTENAEDVEASSVDDLKTELKGGFFNDFKDLDKFSNKILVTMYCTEMFSCFTTNRDPDTEDGVSETIEKSLTKIDFSTENNYFYQTELEFLYANNEDSATKNLATVVGVILLIRFVCNFTSTFIISEVNNTIIAIGSLAGIFAPIVSGLARVVFAFGESVMDIDTLKDGGKGALVKTSNNQWKFSVEGILSETQNQSGTSSNSSSSESFLDVTYEQYLKVLLFLKSANTLTTRASRLIEFNMTNIKDGINADEEKMSEATLYDMSKLHTTFKLETSANVRMLFLSLPIATNSSIENIPSGTFPIKTTTIRGY